MEELTPHYKVVQKIPVCPACKVELQLVQNASIPKGQNMFNCPICKKTYIVPTQNWGYVGILQSPTN